MLLVTYQHGNGSRLAFLIGDKLYDCNKADQRLPETGEEFVASCERLKAIALQADNTLQTTNLRDQLDFIEIGEAKDVTALVWPGM